MLPLLEIKNLSVDFETDHEITHAVQNVSLTVHQGEIVALAGESGSGKSVTSLSVLQLLPAPPAKYKGEIIFYTHQAPVSLLQLSPKSLQTIRGNRIAMIFQEPMTSLNPVISCGQQIAEALLAHRNLSYKDAKKRVIEWLDKVKLPQPEQLFYRYPHQLSGGQKQRVMIAMAMICRPSLLICDEPTTALDVTVQKSIIELIKELQQEQQMGVIFITHDLGIVAQVADRAAIMYKGTIVEQGTVQQIFQNPQHSYTKALLACRPSLHIKGERLPTISDFQETGTTSSSFTAPHTPAITIPVADLTQNDAIVQVQNLSVSFPAKTNLLGKTVRWYRAVNNVSFSVFKGETVGLVGESGCGKTTLGRTLLRLIEPSAGKVIINGKDITAFNKRQLKSLRQNVQLIFQDPYSSLNPRLTISAAIAEPLKVFGIEKDKSKRKKKVLELLDKVNLPAQFANRYPHEFSGGQRQRIVIARALALNPSFLVCDESVSALDVSVQAQVLNLLNDLKKQLGLTMLFISHDLSIVRYMSDNVMVMKEGKIIESGDAATIYSHPKSDYTKKLLAAIPG